MKTTREVMAEVMAESAGDEAETPIEPAESAAEVAEPEAQPEPEHAASEPEEAPEPKGDDRPRKPDGKFAKAPKVTEQKPAASAQPKLAAAPAAKVEQQPAEAAHALKAPADWRPAAKEEWAKLPRVVQEEAVRLHAEVKRTLQDSATARQTAEAFQRTVAPFEHMFRAAGKNPVEGVGWLVQQYAQLQTAPMAQRAQIVAGLVRDFIGVDEGSINLLASALEGKPAPAGAGVPTAMRPEQIQQLVRQEAQAMQAESQRQGEIKAIQDFEASGPEFLPNLTNEIAALVTLAKKQGKPITIELLKEAHTRALRINPETAAILKQRDDAARAKTSAAEAAKRAAAASGIKTEPAGPSGTGTKRPKTTREQMAQEFAAADSGHV